MLKNNQNNIAAVRMVKGMTQEQLAKKVGVTRPYLSEIETGKRNPTVSIAKKLCKALESTFELLFSATKGGASV